MKSRWMFLLLTAALLAAPVVRAQKAALKTNLLYWATTTPNLGVEFGVGTRTTLGIAGGYNFWVLNPSEHRKIKHWIVLPEFRYWLCDRFKGHFLGAHGLGGEFNASGVRIPFLGKESKNNRYQGWSVGAGVTYGYAWILGGRWNMEASLGLGYVYSRYTVYDRDPCSGCKGRSRNHYFGPTRLGLSIVYMIR